MTDCGCVMRWNRGAFKFDVICCPTHDTPEWRAHVAAVMELAEWGADRQ